MATTSLGVDTLRMRAALVVCIAVVLGACVGQTTLPSPSPTPPPSATTTPTATAVPRSSPSATPRSVRPFDRVLTIAIPGQPSFIAPDRERVAYVATGGDLVVVDVATGATTKVHTPQQGWHVELDPHGLRGDLLVFSESRTDGQRTDTRVLSADLRGATVTRVQTLDDYSSPFLGGGDTWRPRAPVTNGTILAWVRVDQDRSPFGIHVVVQLPVQGGPRAIQSGTSPVWIDLDDAGRLAISTLITAGERAELALWRDGQRTSIGMRGSPDGGPARFIGDRLFWGLGPGIAARIERGQLITIGGAVQDVAFPGCAWTGATARHLAIGCEPGPSGTFTLLDPLSGTRGDAIASFQLVAGPRAAVWREGTLWWLGILAP